jgi:hypothetical protein
MLSPKKILNLEQKQKNDVELLEGLQYTIPVDGPRDVVVKLVLGQIPITKRNKRTFHYQNNIWQKKGKEVQKKETPLVWALKHKKQWETKTKHKHERKLVLLQ